MRILYRRCFVEEDVFDLSAQLAYYFLMSLFPFLLFLITLLGFFPVPTQDAVASILEYAPADAKMMVQKNVQSVLDASSGGLLSLGIALSLISASSGVHAVMRVLNRAYGVEETRSYLKVKGMSLLFTVGIIACVTVALCLPVFGKAIETLLVERAHMPAHAFEKWRWMRYTVSSGVLFFVFATLYYYAPNIRLTWKQILPGAAFAVFGWQAASLGFSEFVGRFGDFSATYGGLGSVVVMMLWFYLSAMVLALGGKLNAALQIAKYSE